MLARTVQHNNQIHTCVRALARAPIDRSDRCAQIATNGSDTFLLSQVSEALEAHAGGDSTKITTLISLAEAMARSNAPSPRAPAPAPAPDLFIYLPTSMEVPPLGSSPGAMLHMPQSPPGLSAHHAHAVALEAQQQVAAAASGPAMQRAKLQTDVAALEQAIRDNRAIAATLRNASKLDDARVVLRQVRSLEAHLQTLHAQVAVLVD